MFKRATIFFSAGLFCAGSIASMPARHFVTPLEQSTWSTEGGPLECRLVHEIAGYGRAVFSRHAGRSLTLRLIPDRERAYGARIRLRSLPPPWKHNVRLKELGTIAFDDARSPFRLEAKFARRMLAELEHGMYPTVDYPGRPGRAWRVRISLSAVNFRPALEAYQACVDELVPHRLEQVRELDLQFGSGQAGLSAQARGRLRSVVAYLKHDPRVRAAVLEGHTDRAGHLRDNYLLARRRARNTRAYLVKQGVAAEKLRIRVFGEARPIASNATARGRARNRRVRVRLVY